MAALPSWTTTEGDEASLAGAAALGSRGASGAPTFQLLVRHGRTLAVDGLRADDDVAALEAAAAARTGVPAAAVWLSHAGKRLAPGRTLGECGVAAGATVHLAVRGRGGMIGRPYAASGGAGSSSSTSALESAGISLM